MIYHVCVCIRVCVYVEDDDVLVANTFVRFNFTTTTTTADSNIAPVFVEIQQTRLDLPRVDPL